MATENTPIAMNEDEQNQNDHQMTSSSTTSRPRKYYRGGFSTSICNIFIDPTRRTDCCAIACCGVLSSDRSQYLLTGKRPPPLWLRISLWLIIPAIFIGLMNYFVVDVPAEGADNDNGEGETVKAYPPEIFWPFVLYMIVIIMHGFYKNRMKRKEIMIKLYEERAREQGEEVNPQQLELFLSRQILDIKRAHSCWSCCYAHDHDFRDEYGMVIRVNTEENIEEEEYEKDLCTYLWSFISKMFWCCGCWCQCFGFCALAQEEREVNRLTGNEVSNMDYLTFQPYEEYYPAINDLRENQIKSPWKHVRAISDLSSKLLKHVAVVLVVIILYALSSISSSFTWENLIVLFLTFGQAFFIEYLVHWRWNLFDLSFDSVIKYFACGFLLTTPLAVVFEMIVSTIASIVVLILGAIVLVSDSDLANEITTNPTRGMKDLAVEYPGLFIFINFVNAYLVAALCEESIKYFGYRMVETPDLLSSTTNNSKTMKSTGAGVTVAMVSVALGFACCENLMYIFVYSPPSLGVEVSTLLARSLFPVHPLCAAIQSIGVCKRDIEGDKRYGLGWIILPAMLLHGTFDFVLMLAAYFQQVDDIKEGNDDDGNVAESDKDEDVDLASQLPSLICGMALVIFGYAYYIYQSRAQTKRLIAADNNARDQNSLLV